VRTGIPNAPVTSFAREQEVSAAEGPVTLTITSSNAAVGQLVTTSATAAVVNVQVPANASRSGSSVALAGVAFDPLTAGSTNVSAAATGLDNSFSTAIDTVNVSP